MTNPILFLSTFNGSLAFTDANGAGAWTAVDPERFSNGLWLEEATTNLVVNPSAEPGDSWWEGAAFVTMSRPNDEEQLYSDYVIKGVWASGANDSNAALRVYAGSLSIGEVYTFSASVFVPTGSVHIKTSVAGIAYGTEVTTAHNTWTVLSQTFTATGTSHAFTFHPNTQTTDADDFFYVDGAQCELKAYATSYADGTLGTGYAWTGTAHDSTSTRAASSVSVDQDGTARIDPASGAIAFRYKRLIDTGAEEIILTSGVVGAGTDYLEIGVDTSDDLYMEWNSDNAGAERVTIATTIAVDTDYFFYFDWDSTTIRASIDNGSLSSDTRAAAEGDWSTGDLTLSAAVGSHIVGPFAVFDGPLTTKEITYLDTHNTWSFGMFPLGSRANIFQLRPKAVT